MSVEGTQSKPSWISKTLSWLRKTQNRESASLTILFADICQSTRLFEKYGDDQAQQIVAQTLDILIDLVRRADGAVIKTIGDEVMCTFQEVNTAARVAHTMQHLIKSNVSLKRYAISIRIGMHYGDVVLEKNDVFGDAVNVASRMAGMAKADQIITSGNTIERLDNELKASTRFLRRERPRGKEERIDVCEIIWQEDRSDLTVTLNSRRNDTTTTSLISLVLRYRDIEMGVDKGRPTVRIGREEQNDLIVNSKLVSRMHATIEFQNGKFVLIDKSHNGTYICTSTGESLFAHRETIPLYGKGIISLGHDVDANDEDWIYYTCDV
ncbi:MAG: adenylate/guanylate cyclase domain-containing protein [Calditrichia bacterium]